MKITKRADGRYCATVNLGRGKRKFIYGRTIEEVKAKAYAAGNTHHTGGVVPTAKGTVAAFLDRWIDFLRQEGRVRPRTIQGWENYCRIYLKPALGHIQLAKLSPADVAEFLAARQPRPRPDGAKGRRADKLSPSTMRNALRVLRAALKQAHRWELVARNVASAEYVDAPRGGEKEASFLTEEEAARLVGVLDKDRLGALFLTMIATGMRPSEAYGVTWQRVDLDAGVLRVRQSLEYDRASKTWALADLKTESSRRDLVLPPEVVDALLLHRTEQKRERLFFAKEWGEAPLPELVFTTRNGRPLDASHVRRTFRRLLDKAEIAHATPYSLRHSWATLALAQGVSMRVVMEQLGHSNLGTTSDVYSHVVERLQHEASAKVGAVLFGRKGEGDGA